MDELHVRRLVGEIMIAGFPSPTVDVHARTLLLKHHVRNIILFTRNVTSLQQVSQLNEELQRIAREDGADGPLLIATDQENGIVRRVAPDLPGLPGNMAIGATRNQAIAADIGQATGRELASVGINMNLGPVLDVNNNPNNPVIGVRSFGEDPTLVAKLGTALLTAMQAEGVAACAKHFPGHGDTATDSHLDVPTIPHGRDRLDAIELVPFQAAIAAGVDAIMTAHVVFPAVEPTNVPATLSHAVLTGFLRQTLQYEGVICTDCLEMNAISETIGVGEGAVQAVLAGADLVMVSHLLERQEAAIEHLVAATLEGRIGLQRLESAAHRVRALKAKRLQASASRGNLLDFASLRAEAIDLQQRIAGAAVTCVTNQAGHLPFDAATMRQVHVVMDATVPHMSAADPIHPVTFLTDPLKARLPYAKVILHEVQPNDEHTSLAEATSGADLIVAGLNGVTNEPFVSQLRTLCAQQQVPVAVIALQSPYHLAVIPEAKTTLAMYECTPWMAKAAIDALFGGACHGQLPVTIQ